MLAGGMTIAFPGMEPASAANPNLIVSATTFGGPMIVEVVIDDESYRDDTNESMPSVTVDGHDLVVAQGSDGSWYGYFVDSNMAKIADEANTGFEFGIIPTNNTSVLGANHAFFDSNVTVYAPGTLSPNEITVLKNPRTLDTNTGANNDGQIKVQPGQWPFIQAIEFTDNSKIKVVYRSGTDQTQVITYDENMDDFASYSTDRTTYPHGANVHLVIDDMQLNIDPTDEDVWTFDITGNQNSYYGNSINATTPALQNALKYGDNGFLDITKNGILGTVKNNDSLFPNSLPIANLLTVEEDFPNTGKFENTDAANDANLKTTDNLKIRGDSGILDYNDERRSILVDFFTGSISMDMASIDQDWSSGEKLTVTVTDEDQNVNTKVDDDFSVSDPTIFEIPALKIGSPISIDDKTVLSAPTGVTIAQLELQNTSLQNEIDIATTNQTSFSNWLGLNQTSTDVQQGVVNQAQANILDDITNNNGTNVPALQALLVQAQTELTANQTSVNTSQLGVNQLSSIITSNTLLIATNLSAIAQGFDGTILAKIFFDEFSSRLIANANNLSTGVVHVNYPKTIDDLQTFINGTNVYSFINYDVSSLKAENVKISLYDGTTTLEIASGDKGFDQLNATAIQSLANNVPLTVIIDFTSATLDGNYAIVMDFMRYAGEEGRINDAIYRYEAEETTLSSGIYTGTIEYTMLNQINIFDVTTFSGLETIGDQLEIIVHEDLTDEDAVELIYNDINKPGQRKQISAQTEAPTQSARISFNDDNYKVGDTVTITLEDSDLNSDSETVDIYTVVQDNVIGINNNTRAFMLDITFNDQRWVDCKDTDGDQVDGLFGPMSSIVETSRDSGIFTTTFQVPKEFCETSGDTFIVSSVTGNDIEVNYLDFRDASGEDIEIGDSAGIRAHTGSVSFDRTVYPIPFGSPSEATDITSASYFPVHATSVPRGQETTAGLYLANGDLTIHVRVNDPDYDLSESGEDKIAEDTSNGPIKVSVIRGSDALLLGTAGAAVASGDKITISSTVDKGVTREFGPMTEVSPDSGIFELDLPIRYTDGPSSSTCPASVTSSLEHIKRDLGADNSNKFCILQGDILQVEYTDPTDASGDRNTVTDSATFDLRNGVLQSDKSVYIIGSDMILTLIEPDLDLDNDQAETYDLDLIEWDSDAATTTMGNLGGADNAAAFDPEPSAFRETGDSTGIFQIVIEIPESLSNDTLERGEEIVLEYTDWGPSGADYVGDEDEDVNVTIFTSNFGATIELDQKVYTWTDKVYITVVAPDHNFDGDLVDEIGNTEKDPIKVSTRGSDIDNYKLVETGTDTGIFTGEVILTGFLSHDADGDGDTKDASGAKSLNGGGPTDGLLPADDDDGLTVSFEFSEDETVVGSALIRWNIGEVQWLEASYPASGTGVVRVIDPDMNLNPEAVDNYDVDVWSDSDAGGIDLTVTETNEATGIFEGTVFFTVTDESSGHRLRVAEGDTVTAEYEDNTLPDPYTTADELDVTATTLIGTLVPPLERVPASNLRTVDAFGNSLDAVSVDQQVQISADLANGQDREQAFAYLVQIQDGDGVTVSLAWISGTITSGQSFSPALSWIPTASGSYTATAFVWESVDNPTALSPPVSTTVSVS